MQLYDLRVTVEATLEGMPAVPYCRGPDHMGGHRAQFDLPLDQLRAYRPDLTPPDDFDDFWEATLADARRHPLDATFEPVDNDLAVIDTFDVTFCGFGGSPIRGGSTCPRRARARCRASWSSAATAAAAAWPTKGSSGRSPATRT